MKHRYLAFTQWQGTLKKSVYKTKVFCSVPALTRAFSNSDPALPVIACRSDPFSIISLKVKPSTTHRVMLHHSKCDNFGINNHDISWRWARLCDTAIQTLICIKAANISKHRLQTPAIFSFEPCYGLPPQVFSHFPYSWWASLLKLLWPAFWSVGNITDITVRKWLTQNRNRLRN